ncbi:MAG: rod shape-determining protein RodA [Acidobacteria bacterium]|nr:rod shape-determining protein RodA [Acidobacteriota bacterium]
MRRLDPWLLLATLVIGVCAYLAQTSTAEALASPGYANRQLVWLTLGGALVLLLAFADYRVLARFSPLFYVASLAVLVFLLVASPLRAGTHSWFVIGKFTLQPSEFARIATILAVAALAGEHRKETLSRGLVLRLVAIIALPVILVVLQPDLGVALTYAPILLAALWVGGLPWKVWVGLVAGALVVTGAAWLWLLKPYQKERILTFVDAERAPYGAGYQQRQSKIAVGSGEVTGKGLRSGTQSQLRFLPAQHTDFIFAVWAEETGFVGASILVLAYGLLIARIFLIALHARDRTGALVAGCIGVVLASQVIVNVAMVTGMAPTTGITLPLMSYGGSSILATAIALGLVQSVWRLRFANV